MRDFMVTLLICSVTMSAVAVLYMAFTPLLAKRYSEKWRYYAWIVILAGLIIPFRPHFGNAIVNVEIPGGAYLSEVVKPENTVTADDVSESIHNPVENNAFSDFIVRFPKENIPTSAEISENSSGIDMVAEPAEDTEPSVASQSIVADWWLVISAAWLTGMIGFLAYHMIHYYRFSKAAGRWSKTVKDGQALELFHNLKTEMNISKTIGLQVCPLIGSPMLIGLFRPRILLPKANLSKDELYFILMHELVHYKRKDILYKCFMLIAEAVHWFNPIIHLTTKAINAGCELSCDAEVINGTDSETRQHYSETIIAVAKYRSKINTILSTNFYGGKKGMKNRILSIADKSQKRKGIIIICFALILTICTSLVLAANAPLVESPNSDLPENADINTNVSLIVNSAMPAGQSPSITDVLFAPRFDKYKDYGITYDVMTDSLYYNGELVRYFEDFHVLDENGNVFAGTNYSSANGTVDVHGVRDLSQKILNDDGSYSSGKLIGVEPDSQAEFDARTIAWQGDFQATVTHEGNDMDYTPDELSRQNKTIQQIFSEYEEYGITFDENSINGGSGNVYYKGQLVKLFIDDNPYTGAFRFSSSDGGEITVCTIYDEHGTLINVEIELTWADTEKMFKESFSIYEQYGLTRNADTGRLYYNGKLVRHFEDRQTVNANISSYEDGDVDVRAVRDSNGDLIGITLYSQADFDARTLTIQSDMDEVIRYPAPGEKNNHSGYTEEEYVALMKLKTDDYRELSVGEFTARFADIKSIYRGHNPNDENVEFLTALGYTCGSEVGVGTASNKRTSKNEYYGATLFYTFSWDIADEDKITVGERNDILNACTEAIRGILESKNRDELQSNDIIAVLQSEYNALADNLSNGIMTIKIVVDDCEYCE